MTSQPSCPPLPLRLVLVEPQTPGNVGAIARSMANFGARDLVLVFPLGEPEGFRGEEALRRARWASGILTDATVSQDLFSALAGCGTVYGSSSHPWELMKTVSPEEFARQLRNATESLPTGLVLGREDRGLTREEQSLCSGIVGIPTSQAYPDLNLSHAATVILYEASKIFGGHAPPVKPTEPSFEEMSLFLDKSRDLLMEIDFLKEETCQLFMPRLQAWMGRKGITRAELMAMQGMVHRAGLALKRGKPS